MAREGTQQRKDQAGDRQDNATSTGGSATNRAQAQQGTQAQHGERERSITTNREQGRQSQASTGMTRRSGSSPSRQGRTSGLDSRFMLMQRMADDMDRLFDQLGFGRSATGLSPSFGPLLGNYPWNAEALSNLPTQSMWSPQVDVVRRGDKLVVRADVPGMNKDDLHVDVEDNVLTIRGERREEYEDESDGVFRTERSYGEFYRAIPLPEGVRADQCEAKYEDGVLEVTLKAPEQDRSSKRIPVR